MLIGAASLLALLTMVVLIGLADAQAEPIVRRIAVKMPDWTTGTPPLQVALLSDIHLGNRGMEPQRLTSIVNQVNAAQPDLVLIAGDFVAGRDATGASQQASGLTGLLVGLRAPLGVIAVLGNHDHWTDPGSVRSALAKAGIVVLENQAVRRGPLAIVGVGDRFSGHDDVSQVSTDARLLGGTPIVLTHSPDVVASLPTAFTLVLAGHTHCGQVVLPWLGPLLTRSPLAHWRQLYDPRYRCGLVRDPGRLTVITAGLGSGTLPLRLGAMPDWWLLTLHP
jgi:uncharacterized protein